MATRTRVMWLTGAAGGIGRAVARRLYAAGHTLVLSDLDEDALLQAAHEDGLGGERAVCAPLDVRDPEAWEVLAERIVREQGALDVLMNIAGVMRSARMLETTPVDVDLHLDVNTKGVIHGTRAAARRMLPQGDGHIVNVASLMAIAPAPGFSLYCASKHAVRGFSLCVAQELRAQRVAVTVVCPDAVETEMFGAQQRTEAAAIAFSGPRPLAVAEVAEVITDKVLKDRPMEVTIVPPRTGRAAMSKVVAAAPGLAIPLSPVFTVLGERSRKRRLRRAAKASGR